MLLGCIAFCEAVGFVGGMVTRPALPVWYAGLRKPPFNPPNWLFAPVWTALFAGMGVALYLVLVSSVEGSTRTLALVLFGVQLVLNAIWSLLFFGARSPGWAMLEIALLWTAVGWCMLVLFDISNVAGWLFVPYLLWVSFAALLNFELWRLNRGRA